MNTNSPKIIVISAINIRNGGPLTILRDCLQFAEEHLNKFKVIALVHKIELFAEFKTITLIEFPKSASSYFYRFYYEYYYFKKLSNKITPHLWLSMHDITPNIEASIMAVYCHNPAPFYKISFGALYLEPKMVLFKLLYKWLYRINIVRNDYVIVQQNWLRSEFEKMFHLNNVIVAHPVIPSPTLNEIRPQNQNKYTFIYPAFPRIFKNYEVICKAVELLYEKGFNEFTVLLTIAGHETKYAKKIFLRYHDIPMLKFIGLQSKERIHELYSISDCMIFPSKLETWGLPITEFRNYNKTLLLADMPYARETVGDYELVKFFHPDDFEMLSRLMESAVRKNIKYNASKAPAIEMPFAEGWMGLFNILLN